MIGPALFQTRSDLRAVRLFTNRVYERLSRLDVLSEEYARLTDLFVKGARIERLIIQKTTVERIDLRRFQ